MARLADQPPRERQPVECQHAQRRRDHRQHRIDQTGGERRAPECPCGEVEEQQVDDVRQALKRVADKLLHEPTVRAKKLAADSGTVDHATALQELFGFQLEGTGVAVEAAELPDLPDLPDTHPERKDA